MAWQWVNNATDSATAAKLDLEWEANQTYLHDITHDNNHIDVICISTGDTNTYIQSRRDTTIT